MKPIDDVSHDILISEQSIDDVFVYLFNCTIGWRQKQGMGIGQYVQSNLLFCDIVIMKRHEGVFI